MTSKHFLVMVLTLANVYSDLDYFVCVEDTISPEAVPTEIGNYLFCSPTGSLTNIPKLALIHAWLHKDS